MFPVFDICHRVQELLSNASVVSMAVAQPNVLHHVLDPAIPEYGVAICCDLQENDSPPYVIKELAPRVDIDLFVVTYPDIFMDVVVGEHRGSRESVGGLVQFPSVMAKFSLLGIPHKKGNVGVAELLRNLVNHGPSSRVAAPIEEVLVHIQPSNGFALVCGGSLVHQRQEHPKVCVG